LLVMVATRWAAQDRTGAGEKRANKKHPWKSRQRFLLEAEHVFPRTARRRVRYSVNLGSVAVPACAEFVIASPAAALNSDISEVGAPPERLPSTDGGKISLNAQLTANQVARFLRNVRRDAIALMILPDAVLCPVDARVPRASRRPPSRLAPRDARAAREVPRRGCAFC